MWKFDSDLGKFVPQLEILDKRVYNDLRQDLEDLRFYSKCFDGTTYLPINNLDDIYDSLKYVSNISWSIDTNSSPYSSVTPLNKTIDEVSISPVDLDPLSQDGSSEYYKYLLEYGFTIKNLFTPERVIKDSINNFLEVDVATTEQILDINGQKRGLQIDGVILKPGHRVLLKDQQTFDTLSNAINPDTYFQGNYYIVEEDTNTTTYFYYNEQNGIYTYDGETLTRTDELDNYDSAKRYSVNVKLGNQNRDTQFHLSRLNNGYYPLTQEQEPIEFLNKKNWVLRNQVEYQNIFELEYEDVIKHGSYTVGSFSVPERTLIVGDFGGILNVQDGVTQIIKNKFKARINAIAQTDTHYWAVGEEGTLLKIDKVYLTIELIELGTINNFNDISFFNNNRGILVGDYNEIYCTFNSGNTWNKVNVKQEEYEEFIYNTVVCYSLDTAYIGGNNGVFLKLTLVSGEWQVQRIIPTKIESNDNSFDVVDNINSIIKLQHNSTYDWNLYYNYVTASIPVDKESLLVAGDNDLLFVCDLNDYSDKDYIFFDGRHTERRLGNIKKVVQEGTNLHIITQFTEDLGLSSFDYSVDLQGSKYDATINDFVVLEEDTNIVNGTFSKSISKEYNSLFNYNDQELVLVGDISLTDSYDLSIGTSSLVNLTDSTFKDKLKPRMLYLDYDIGSKLYFFDFDENYRLPNYVEFNANGNGYTVEISSLANELSWMDYMKDENRVFIYNEDKITANEVLINTKFTKLISGETNVFTFSGGITNDLTDFGDLAPTLTGTVSIGAPTSIENMYVKDGLLILNVGTSSTLQYSLGDIFNIDSDVVEGDLILNRIENISGYDYLYFYSRFDGNIENNLVGTTYSVTFKNKNRFAIPDELEDNFNSHKIGDGYQLTDISETFGVTASTTESYRIDPLFNNKTAYYNLQADVEVIDDLGTNNYLLEYVDSFLDFGYSPMYNILDYLSFINSSVFTPSKTFAAMPVYNGISAGGSSTTEDVKVIDNKLAFTEDLKFEYDSIWTNTFIDVYLDQGVYGTVSTEKALVLRKEYDETLERYVVHLHKEVNSNTSTGGWTGTIDILSRNTLQQISDDLQELNNIQKAQKNKTLAGYYGFTVLQKELNFRFNTDNYAKILLSDGDIKDNLTTIIYIDSKNELSLNLIDLGEQRDIEITNVFNYGGQIGIKSPGHELSVEDGIILRLENTKYDGFYTVTNVVDSQTFVLDKPYPTDITKTGQFTQFIFDPFFNYEPTDILDVGVDGKNKIAVDILPNNFIENADETVSLVNLDLNKYKFKLIDTLDIVKVAERFPWILEAEITDALIGEDENGIAWYKGTWHCGRWFGGTWYSGEWRSGQWYNGEFWGVPVETTAISGKPNLKVLDNNLSRWYDGDFRGGLWHNGTWFNGNFRDGTWETGDWYDGTWHDGTWESGIFYSGVWITGIWQNGKFNCDNGLAQWVDGEWNGGDFECGIWYNGKFTELGGNKSRFGTRSTNSRKSIWRGGKFFSGEFHSYRLEDEDGNTLPSTAENNKLSVWETGIWYNGSWYGGTAYHIIWKTGTWYNGVLKDMPILAIHPTIDANSYWSPVDPQSVAISQVDDISEIRNNEPFVVIEGEWLFNRNDEIYIIDNDNFTTYSVGTYSIGNNTTPGSFLVKDIKHFENDDIVYTEILTYKDIDINIVGGIFPPTSTNIVAGFRGSLPIIIPPGGDIQYYFEGENTGVSVVSKFQKAEWKNGIWFNGIFENNNWEQGIWIDGVFEEGEFL